MAEPSQILVVRLSSAGDVLLATPLVRVLRRSYPRARLTFLVKPAFADLVRLNPRLDGVLTWPEAAGGKGAGDGWPTRAAGPLAAAVRGLAANLRREGPVWLVDLQASPRSRAFARLARPLRTFTYPKPYLRRQLLLRVKVDRFPQPAPSVAERYFAALRPLGLQPDGEGLELVTGAAADARADELLHAAAPGPDAQPAPASVETGAAPAARPDRGEQPRGAPARWIAVAPGASWATKRWPAEAFAAAARALAQATGCGIVVVGARADLPAAAAVHALLAGAGLRALRLAGELTPLESAAVLRRCRVLLANDSGATHLAAAVGTPVVALFGSTVPQFGFAPYGVAAAVLGVDGLPCRPCTHVGRGACPLGHFRCMREIAPGRVADAAHELMAATVESRARV